MSVLSYNIIIHMENEVIRPVIINVRGGIRKVAVYKNKIQKASCLFVHQWLKCRKHNLQDSIYSSITEYQIPTNKYIKRYARSLRKKSCKLYLEILKKT